MESGSGLSHEGRNGETFITNNGKCSCEMTITVFFGACRENVHFLLEDINID